MTENANAEGRFSLEGNENRVSSFGGRGSINSRASMNKKNLSIKLPEDDPGTHANPDFKTPT